MYLVFARMSGGVTVGSSGLCCCVLCLLSAIYFPLWFCRKCVILCVRVCKFEITVLRNIVVDVK